MRLTAEQRDAMLADYEAGTETVRVLADRYGVCPDTVNNLRREAGVSGRAKLNRTLIPVEPVNVSVTVLPVYPVRLVSRPMSSATDDDTVLDGVPLGGDDGRS